MSAPQAPASEGVREAKMDAFQEKARDTKCKMLCAWLFGETARIMEQVGDDEWFVLAQKAGTNKPSPESRQRVIEMLREEQVRITPPSLREKL